MEVRLLTISDAIKYWEIRLEGLKQNPEAFATSYEEAIQREKPIEMVKESIQTKGNYTFGAFDKENLIGVVTLIQEKYSKMQHKASIVGVYVTPTKRNLGVAKILLSKAIQYAISIDQLEKLNLSVVTSNEQARRLYMDLGFKVFGVEEKALKIGDLYYNEEHMSLNLK